MSTYFPSGKGLENERQWHIVDAAGLPVGRLATEVARILMGKHKPTYTPFLDAGDHVIVINAAKVIFKGNKTTDKLYHHHTGFPGGLKTVSARDPKASNADAADVRKRIVRAETAAPTVAETRLLELLVHDEELRRALLPQVDESDYAELPTAVVFRALKELDARGEAVDFSTLGALTEDDAVAADVVPLVLMHEPERAEGEATDVFLAEAESCLTTLRLMSYDRRIRELAAEISSADRAGEDSRRDALIMEDLELKRRRSALLPHAGSVGGPAPSST